MIAPIDPKRTVTTVNISLDLARDLDSIQKKWYEKYHEKTSKTRLVNRFCRRVMSEGKELE